MNLSPEDVEDILKILDSTDYDELHIETERFVLRLRRAPGGWTEEREELGAARLVGVAASGGGDVAPGAPDPGGKVRREGGEETGRESGREGLHPVRAPLPGVFYRAPKPGADPFVRVGDHVEADTIVAILETMKLMNPVRAGTPGTVADFEVANGQPAAQDGVLVWLAPDAP